MNPVLTFFSLLLLLPLLGCTSKEINRDVDIRLHDIWALKSIDGSDYKRDSSDKFHPVIEIYVQDRRIHGTTNCNTLNGDLVIDGDRISFIDLIFTELACHGDFEKRFLSILKEITNYKIEKGRLMLFDYKTVRLIFQRID